MDHKSDSNYLTEQCHKYKNNYRKKQQALKSLNNYLEQLKIHFDLSETDLIKILKIVLSVKNKNSLIKKLWNIFK